MTESLVEQIWADVSARVGDDAQYTTEEVQQLADRTIVTQLGFEEVAGAFKVGSVQASVVAFDAAWLVVAPDGPDQKSGLFVSIQRGGDATMADVRWCIEYLTDDEGFAR